MEGGRTLVLGAVTLGLGIWLLTGAPCGARMAAPGAKYLLAVGVDQYFDRDIPTLHYAASDARRLYDALYQGELRRFPQAVVDRRFLLLTSGGARKPTQANVISSFRALARQAQPGSQFWFYFSGHGLDMEGISYLVPIDYRPEAPGTLVSTHMLRDILEKDCSASQKIFVLDSCHSGSARDLQLIKKPAPHDAAPDVITLAACKMNQCAYEFPGVGGAFSNALVEGLQAKADANQDGTITTVELENYLSQAVQETVHSGGGVFLQTPQIVDHTGKPAALCVVDPGASSAAAEPSGGQLVPLRPLPPGVLILVEESRTNSPNLASNIAETSLKKAFIEAGFPVFDAPTTRRYQHATTAGARAALLRQLRVGYVVRGHAETQARQMDMTAGMITVTATLNAELDDAQGRAIDSESVESDPKLAGTEGAAARLALLDAVSKLAEALVPAANKAYDDTLDR